MKDVINANNVVKDFGLNIKEYTHGELKEHNHPFFELAYIISGAASHTLDTEKTTLKKGTYFIVDYKKYHRFYNVTDEINIINCMFVPGFIDKTMNNCKRFRDLIEYYQIKTDCNALTYEPTKFIFTDEDGSIYSLLKEMEKEFSQKKPGYVELLRFYLMEIIIKTMRKISCPNKKEDDINDYVLKYISQHYSENIQLGDIAKKLKYSISYLSRKFKTDNNMTFMEYIQRTRIAQSCRLLLNTDNKIIVISQRVGYSDINNFNKLFKKYMNTTPREFRKSHE